MQQPFRDFRRVKPEPQASAAEQWSVESTAAVNSNDSTSAETDFERRFEDARRSTDRAPAAANSPGAKTANVGFFQLRRTAISSSASFNADRDDAGRRRLHGGRLEPARRRLHGDHDRLHGRLEEVRPINTPALNAITISLILLGCTGDNLSHRRAGAVLHAQSDQQSHRYQTHENTNRSAQRPRRGLRLRPARLVLARSLRASQRRFRHHRSRRGASPPRRASKVCASRAMRPAKKPCSPRA